MLAKKNRTIDEYKQAGAEMRLFKNLGVKLAVDISKVLSAQDQDMLCRALHRIDEVCSRAEDNMFRDFPELSNDYIDVFYGNVNNSPRNQVEAEQIARARQVADELFERKNN